MKRFIFAYIAFACVFLFIYSQKPKYESDQVGILIETLTKENAPTNCTSPNRDFVYMYMRPDKSTYYYYCTSNYEVPIPQTHIEHYMSANGRFLWSLFGAFVVALLVFYIKPFVHYLNTN